MNTIIKTETPASSGGQTDVPAVTDEHGAPVSTDPGGDQTTAKPDLSSVSGDTFTALIVGTDYQPDLFDDYDLTAQNKKATGFPQSERIISADAILLMRVDRASASFVYSSLPPNMLVKSDGVDTELRTLYDSKGIDYMCEKVTSVTGYKIDYYAAFSVEDFAKIIDKLGGIYYNVPQVMKYEDQYQGLSINLKKGAQQLTGEQAVNMLRYCSYSDGSASRMKLAVSFARELIGKLTAPEYMASAAAMYQGIIGMFQTNFTAEDLTEHIGLIFAYPKLNIVELTYPGSTVKSAGVEYFQPSITAAITMYREYRQVG